MSIGAFTTALLAAGPAGRRRGAPDRWRASLLVAVLTGLVVVRLPPLFLAVSTWLLSWLVLLVAAEFPWLAGGSRATSSTRRWADRPLRARARPDRRRRRLSGLPRVERGASGCAPFGTAGRPRPSSASRATRGSSALRRLIGRGRAAGSLAVQLAGVSDPNAFGPFTSFKLLVAVLLGGASYAGAGVVGVAILGAISLVGHLWAAVQGHAPAQLQPMLTACSCSRCSGSAATG